MHKHVPDLSTAFADPSFTHIVIKWEEEEEEQEEEEEEEDLGEFKLKCELSL